MTDPTCRAPQPSRSGVVALRRFIRAIIDWQVRSPSLLLLLGAMTAAFGVFLASRLELRTQFDQLLPDSQPSVVELRRVAARTLGTSNVFIVIEGAEPAKLREFGDAIVPKLRAIGAPWVGSAEDGIQAARDFLTPRAGLFASVAELERLERDIDDQWEFSVAKGMGADLDDAPAPLSIKDLATRLTGNHRIEDRFPGGYYQSTDAKTLVMVVRSQVAGGALADSREALTRIQQAVNEERQLAPWSASGLHVGYAGDLVTGLFEYGAVRDDLVSVGIWGVSLVLLAVVIFFMRVRAVVAMGVTIATGLAWTFGFTELVIGHLNVATGFLFSIVAGNGINCGIIYMARYFEERRKGTPPDRAIIHAHRTTWLPTLAAAVAAAGSYGSLFITDFRGFKHFAVIGAFGMLACWVSTYALVPAVLVLVERACPFDRFFLPAGIVGRLRRGGVRYDAPFTWLVGRAPRAASLVGGILAIASVGIAMRYVQEDPMEYNMRRLQNDLGQSGETYRLSALARDVLGANTESGMVILADRIDQVAPIERALEARRDAVPHEDRPFEAVHALEDFVPDDQAIKIPRILAIAAKVRRARARGMISDVDWASVAPLLPDRTLAMFGMSDLPEDLRRPFTERDGTIGRLVYVEPAADRNDNDLKYLLQWADSFRTIPLPSGEVIRGSGRAVIFADMLRAVLGDIPRAVALSLCMTTMAVALSLRRRGQVLAVLSALAVGVAWVGALMAVSHVKINFFNFIALPITFGIGVDYAVNVVQRHGEGEGAARALRGAGGAVVLCSLTTILGYLVLLRSINQAVRSIGLVAVLGEVCCLVAAMVVLPAALMWRERTHAKTNSGRGRPAPSIPRAVASNAEASGT